MTSDLSSTLAILERLIAFPTVSDRSNLDLIAYAADYLSQLGVRSEVFPDATGQKHGLIAQIGPDIPGGVILSGHTDVVPVENQIWKSDPWDLTERDGRFYGRGTCDMKGFLALVLSAVPQMLAAPLQRPIQIAFSFDEEIGCLGTAPLLKAMHAKLPPASCVIVGEPTDWKVVTGHKGGIGLTTRIKGKAAHSSLPGLGVSAISHAAQLIAWHDTQLRQCQEHADLASGFNPPHSTLQVGTIHGGAAMNIVPADCTMETDIRFLPEERAEDWIAAYTAEVQRVEKRMQTAFPEASITLSDIEIIPGVFPETDGKAEMLARQVTGDNSDNFVSYQTEAGHFQAARLSTVICGPGSIAEAHQPDEFVSKNQLRQGQDVLSRLITQLS
jgi:acetylornithine deacetylase